MTQSEINCVDPHFCNLAIYVIQYEVAFMESPNLLIYINNENQKVCVFVFRIIEENLQ